MWEFRQKCLCMKIWHRVLTLPVAMLSMRLLHSATVLPSNSYYTVVASIFLVSAASCKAICRVASVRTSYYSQPFWLKVSWERGEVLGVSLARAMARVGPGLAPPMVLLSYVLWSYCHMSYGLMSYGPTVLYPMATLPYCHPMVLQLYVLLSSYCRTVLCPCSLMS